MEFLTMFIIFVAFNSVVYSRSLSEETTSELQSANCSCDWRYLQHYETKGCILVATDSCGCPQKFMCPSNQTQQTATKVCTYQNKEYKVGSKIISSDICQVCRCRNGVPPYISCVAKECPEIKNKPGQDCHLIYKEDECCPVNIECFGNDTEVTSNETCEYDGKLYPFGSKIYLLDDPCQICICDENWNDGNNSSCYQQDCMFEKNKLKLDSGCIPIYHESRCCPVEFYCPSSHNLSYSVLSSNESSETYNLTDDQCMFAGQSYARGEEIIIDNPCVRCTCLVPPDLTCIHQTCPSSPGMGNCYAFYNPEECCPTYECMLGDTESHPVGCPTPVCAHSGCHIEIPPGHECPTCVCEEKNSELEHNNLEQVQQFPQDIEQQFEHAQQLFEPIEISNDYSEDELQMMPIRMDDSEGNVSVMEKMILPELDNFEQFPEGLREMEESSFEENFSTEAVSNNMMEKTKVAEAENATSLPEFDLEDGYNETESNHTEKVLQKRSHVPDAANSEQTRTIYAQQKVFFPQEFNKDLEREDGDSYGKDTSFDDELENFRNKLLTGKNLTINEIININHEVKVPPGCPTPMCEGPWCRIGILPGGKCPTCICKRPTEP